MTATKTRRPRRSPEERAAQKRELMERLDAFRASLATMDDFDAFTAAFLHLCERYSERNAQLILMQRPDATEVRGYNAWRELGRRVQGTGTGIQILAPAGHSDDEAPSEEKPDGTKGRQFFKIAYVFDISNTVPIED